MPNFSTRLFESFILDSTENSFNTLDSAVSSSVSSLGLPVSCSSPMTQGTATKPKHSFASMKILNVNFQPVKNKKEEIWNLIDSADPRVITGTDTWLNTGIHSSEIFPSNYEVIRRDREDGYRGVLLFK